LGRVRESVFGILTPVIENARVLDLFAGSGAFGLEALSRGAASALFVEKVRSIARYTETNIEKTGYGDHCRLYIGDFSHVGKKVAPDETFDLVFADPPYLQGYPQRIIDLVMERDLLSAEGLLVIEMHRRELPPPPEEPWQVVREKRFGATIVWIMRREH
jgi:16S rRNA (guanine(966)-N(2))-methyltransferase RsmD